jgi:cystathionine beta-synthase
LRREGLLAGSSSGTLVAAALRYCREQTEPKRVVTFACDSGNKYLSKMYNDNWLADQGIDRRERTGDLRDLISRRFADQAVVTVAPSDPLYIAHTRMRSHDVSQLPVVQRSAIVGLIDESDLLLAVADDPAGFQQPVERHMISRLVTLPRHARIDEARAILTSGLVVIVADETGFHGLITRTDLLNFLRRR